MTKLSFPFTEEKIRALKVGDEVLISGVVFTGRDAVHKYLHEGGKLPPGVDLKGIGQATLPLGDPASVEQFEFAQETRVCRRFGKRVERRIEFVERLSQRVRQATRHQ